MGRRKTIDRVLALILCVILILLPNTFKVSALTGIEEVVISNIEAFKDSITVEWTPVDGVTAYEIEVDGVVINNGIDTVYKHMGLEQGTSHSYRVRAKIEDTTGAWSDLLLETTLDVTSPHISLIGDEAIVLEVGTSYTDEGAIAIDNVDGDITESITTTGIVDTEILGEYKTVYLVSDSSDNEATVTRAIYVEDTTKPIITLTGNNNIELNIGDTYTEAGAIANDNYDGDI
ncbi:immunoglobulin-like domain-containing protein, partial [Sporosalibacterium faouarense]|uniref:immunoglobulin-like domain-containing protein n=1 Tax=Sporosalibacterium faouarense TaxID=516123 RepID=UPI00192A7830